MSERKQMTWEEVELGYLGEIARLTVKHIDFESHAVEVLAKQLEFGISQNSRFSIPIERVREMANKEARELLGIKEGEK